MVFRRDTKVDAFQRQISALRQQLGDGHDIHPEPMTGRAAEADPVVDPPTVSAQPRALSRPTSFHEPVDEFNPVEPDRSAFSTAAFDHQTSIVAHDTVWKGDLESTGSVHVHGRVEGSVSAKQDVFVADEAEVAASVAAENVSVAGVVRGTITCANRFEALPQGRIGGDVIAPVLVVHEGATINGHFRMIEIDSIAAEASAAPLRRRRAGSGS